MSTASLEELLASTETAAPEEEDETPAEVTAEAPPEPELASAKAAYNFVVRLNKLFSRLFRTPPHPRTHLDIISILAVFLILLNYTGGRLFTMYTKEPVAVLQWLMLVHASLIKMAVPLFFMTSGALLLGREEPYSRLLSKRVMRFVVLLVVVSVLTYLGNATEEKPATLLGFLSAFYRGKISNHLWVLYHYICFLLSAPYLRKIAVKMRDMDFYWLVVLVLIEKLVLFADYFFFRGQESHIWSFTFFSTARYFLYPLLGYYMDDKLSEEKYTFDVFFILLAATVVTLYLTCVVKQWVCDIEGGWSSNVETYLDSLIVIPSITVFYGVKLWMKRAPASPRLAKALYLIGGCTFGVYLFEGFFRKWTSGVYDLLKPTVGSYFASWVHMLAALLLGLALTFVYKTLTGLVTEGRRSHP